MPRIRYGSLARAVIVLCLLCVWLQLMLSASSGGLYREDELMNANDTSEQVLAHVPPELHKYLTVFGRNSSNALLRRIRRMGRRCHLDPLCSRREEYEAMLYRQTDSVQTALAHTELPLGNSTASELNVTDIRRAVERLNDEQTILNEDLFGPVLNDTVIIAIQVHTRLTYLRHLIVSLAQARGISRALLVFSHDHYDQHVNALVQSIDFTKVLQIFYPHSIQTHPHEFPGTDPGDCPRDAKYEQAVKLKCNNALHPDLHGHYREARYTQTKHHWWWKANRIFSQLRATAHHSGVVLFLEEDHYVAPDFLHVLALLADVSARACPRCEMLSLGTYLKTYHYHYTGDKRRKQLTLSYLQQVKVANEERRRRGQDLSWNYQVYPNLYARTQKVEITPWHSSMHNMGFAFNRTVWQRVAALAPQFCRYDDYNWDYSLLHVSQNRPQRAKFAVVVCKGPRVFHIGECGFHHKKSNCNASTVISKVQRLLQTAKPYLFPARVTATVTAGGAKHNKKLVQGNGGWGDVRDQELCMNMTKIGRETRKYPYYA